MKGTDLLLTIIIIIIFGALFLVNYLSVGIQKIKDDWPKYRCNPMIIPFAGIFDKDVTTNFTYCIQNMQTSYMSELLKPVNYASKMIGEISGDVTKALQAVRGFFNKIRNFITSIVHEIMGVFLNLLIGIQQMTIGLKDLFSKTIGLMVTCIYILQGAMWSMNSAWDGPPGQMLRMMCFHPDTIVQLADGTHQKMKELKLGAVLKNQQTVYGTMNLYNLDNSGNHVEKLYTLPLGEKDHNGIIQPILVTGSHLIFDKNTNNFIYVKDMPRVKLAYQDTDTLACLITSDHTIPLGDYIFHDWEDNNEILG
jgi:hypothetical protein